MPETAINPEPECLALPCRILGIDPSLTRTGMGLIYCPGPKRFRYLASAWVAAGKPGQPWPQRLGQLIKGIDDFLIAHAGPLTTWVVIEDPTDQALVHKNKGAESIAKIGAAFGAAVAAALNYAVDGVFTIPASLWIPKQPGKGAVKAAKHEYNIANIWEHIEGVPAGTKDDEIIACGLARWWGVDRQLPPLLRASRIRKPRRARAKGTV